MVNSIENKVFKISVPISSTNSEEKILNKLKKYVENPSLNIGIKTKLPKKRQSVIGVPSELYTRLKLLYPNYKIDAIIYSIFNVKENELFYGSLLFKSEEGWVREKVIPDVGRIDGYNEYLNKLVELKFVDGWTHALGQILAYSCTYPKMTKELWLLVDKTVKISKEKKITAVCNKYNVAVKFLDINKIF